MGVERSRQAPEFLVREPARTLVFVVLLDALGRIVRPPPPADCEGDIFDSSARTRLAW